MAEEGHEARRAAIRTIIRNQRVGTQEDLRLLLAKEGFDVTQATLSRDLARLKARRVSLPEGGSVYELEEFKASADEAEVAAVGRLITGVNDNDHLVVVQTLPGAASAVAVALDRARLPQVMGTIAGDDTIFIAPARRASAAGLAKHLKQLWRQGGA